jgi:hypothetical protein
VASLPEHPSAPLRSAACLAGIRKNPGLRIDDMTCTNCGAQFQPTPSPAGRRWYRCIDCRKPVNDRDRRKNDPATVARRDARYRANPIWRHKKSARMKLQQAVRSGKIAKQPCEKCGSPNGEAHHPDYSIPFEVRWRCRSCHRRQHGAPPQPYNIARALEVRRAAAWTASKKRWRDPEERLEKSARRKLRRAVASGKIRQPCARCGCPEVVAHHLEYSSAFDVLWLCAPCHRDTHRSSPSPSPTPTVGLRISAGSGVEPGGGYLTSPISA